jgi:hypothetical protein
MRKVGTWLLQSGIADTAVPPLADDPIIIGVASNPKPQHAIWQLHADCAIVQADTSGPELVDSLKMQRWMLGVRS